jgi:hypothetical protein
MVDYQVSFNSEGCLDPPVAIRSTRLSMDLPDRISEEQASCFPVPWSCWPGPIPKSGPVHTTHPGGFPDGMTGRHELFCDGLCSFGSTTATESNNAEASLTSCSSSSNALIRFFAARNSVFWVESTPSRRPASMRAWCFHRWRVCSGTRVSQTRATTASPPSIRSIISRRKCGG